MSSYNVIDAWSRFTSIFMTVIDNTAPIKEVGVGLNPGLTMKYYTQLMSVIKPINYLKGINLIILFLFLKTAGIEHHYENTPIQIYRKFYLQKLKIFRLKNSDIFHISAQNIDCGYSLELPQRGGSNVYPQSMFLSRNKKNNVYPYKPQIYYIKVGFKGVKII